MVSVEGKGEARLRQVWVEETSASKPLMTCRKRMDDAKTEGVSLPWDQSGGRPEFWPGGIRHGGGVTSILAHVWNLGTCRSDAKGEVQVGGPHEGERTDAEHRGGATRSRAEGPVMGLDRRGCLIPPDPRVNLQGEEPGGDGQAI